MRRVPAFSCLLLILLVSPAMGTEIETGDATITHAGLVTSDTLAVTIAEGFVRLGELVEYEPQPADELDENPLRRTTLTRNGKLVGLVTGNVQSPKRFLRLGDSYQGKRADRERLTDEKAWSVRVGQTQVVVRNAYRKSRITNIADRLGQRPEVCFEHTIYLQCDQPIPQGALTIDSTDPVIAPFNARFSIETTRTEAIHVSSVGFRPNDPVKIAVLSCWMGSGGPVDYRAIGLPRFEVIDTQSGKSILQGNAELLRESDQPADHRGLQGRPDGTVANYAGTPTFGLDFSKVTQPGTYQVTVQGIGTSHPFRIANDVYRSVLDLALEGLDAHRWGEDREIKLVDGSTMSRPAAVPATNRAYANVPIFETSAAYTNANFADFEPGKLGEWKPSGPDVTVVGGYMDAGDFDRNHNHWVVGYWLLDLALRKSETDPQLSQRLVEASLWDINFWAKLQRRDGGVPSAVEYAEHPREGEPSWLNSLPIYICAPSRDGNIDFATSSAKAAGVLKQLGRKVESRKLADAAAKALTWTEQQTETDSSDENALDSYMLAVTELWNATGDERWRKKAIEALDVRVPEAWSTVYPDGLIALLTILEMPAEKSSLTDRQRERLEGSVKHNIQMNYLEGSTRRSPFRALKNGWVGVSYGSGGWPTVDSMCILRAWHLFGDEEYLSAAITGLAYCLGGNPTNMVYMTGVNETSVRNVLHCDTRYSGRAAPIGIPIYGPAVTNDLGSAWPLNWHLAGDQKIFPEYQQWPTYENVHQFWNWAVLMEYTVHQSHVSAIYLAGMLDDR